MRNPMTPARRLVLSLTTVLAVTVALSGCAAGDGEQQAASPSPSATSSPSGSDGTSDGTSDSPATAVPPWGDAKPADGHAFHGQGFEFHAPRGWTDATQQARQLNKLVDLAAAGAPDRTGFATNVNVVVADAGVEDPSAEQLTQVSAAIKKRLRSLVARLTINPVTQLDGRPTLDHEGPAVKDGVHYYIHQYVAFDGGNAYTITFSFSRAATSAQRNDVINAVLASWRWS